MYNIGEELESRKKHDKIICSGRLNMHVYEFDIQRTVHRDIFL